MPTTTQEDFDNLKIALESNSIEDVEKILQGFDVTATDQSGWSCIMYGCMDATSPEVMAVLLQKIVAVGDMDMLKRQLTATTNDSGSTCLLISIKLSESYSVVKFLAVVLFSLNLLEQQYEKLDDGDKNRLERKTGIDSSSWTPWLQSHLMATATIQVLFSNIKHIGGNRFLKELLTAGETCCLLDVCLRDRGDGARLELIMNTIEEVGGEEFLAEQISKKRPSDGMTCLFALCKFAPKYHSLSVLVSQMFRFNRRYVRDQLISNPCLECIFDRPLLDSSPDEMKFLFLMVGLSSMTGLFQEHYLRLNKENREKLSRICKIHSGEWRRATYPDATLDDMVGEIKNRFVENNKK